MTAAVLREALSESLEEVLETMFFATVLDDAPEMPAAGGMAARLAFRGNPSGTFAVAVCPGAARSLAAAFLALDEDEVPPGRVAEVVCELANMLCGSALGRLRPDELFELGHPEAVPAGAVQAHAPGAEWRAVDIGDGTVAAGIQIGA